jgi:hypothetical protein
MTIDGDTLEIELDMDLDEVTELKNFVADRLEYIEAITIVGEQKCFATSSLFQLLFSIRQSKPEISIKSIEGDLQLEQYGVMHWV